MDLSKCWKCGDEGLIDGHFCVRCDLPRRPMPDFGSIKDWEGCTGYVRIGRLNLTLRRPWQLRLLQFALKIFARLPGARSELSGELTADVTLDDGRKVTKVLEAFQGKLPGTKDLTDP